MTTESLVCESVSAVSVLILSVCSILLAKKACENLRVPKGLVLAAILAPVVHGTPLDCIRLAHPFWTFLFGGHRPQRPAGCGDGADAVRSRDGGDSGLTGGGSGNAQAETRWL